MKWFIYIYICVYIYIYIYIYLRGIYISLTPLGHPEHQRTYNYNFPKVVALRKERRMEFLPLIAFALRSVTFQRAKRILTPCRRCYIKLTTAEVLAWLPWLAWPALVLENASGCLRNLEIDGCVMRG